MQRIYTLQPPIFYVSLIQQSQSTEHIYLQKSFIYKRQRISIQIIYLNDCIIFSLLPYFKQFPFLFRLHIRQGLGFIFHSVTMGLIITPAHVARTISETKRDRYVCGPMVNGLNASNTVIREVCLAFHLVGWQ